MSNLLAMAFAAVSPYVYVFRSDKVRSCLKEILYSALVCGGPDGK